MTSRNSKNDKLNDKNIVSDYWRERTIFPGVVPKEVKILTKNIDTIEKSFFRKLLKLALSYIQETLSFEQCEIVFENLCLLKECSNEESVIDLSILFAGILVLVRAVLKLNLKTIREEMLMQDLQVLGLPEEFASDVCKVVFGPAHSSIMQEIIAHNPHLPKIDEFDWSLDVTLSDNFDSKVLDPTVTLKLKGGDAGEGVLMEVPPEGMDALRHATASLLTHMDAVSKREGRRKQQADLNKT